MNKFIVATIIGVILFAGAVFSYNFQGNKSSEMKQEHSAGDITTKPVAQSHRSYELEVTSNIEGIKPQQPVNFSFKVKDYKGEVIKSYEVAHEKIMHFIVVRKDLQQFQHIHPDFNQSTGEFNVQVTFPTDGTYRVFPDFTPGDENPSKLTVTLSKDINVGDLNKYTAQSATVDSTTTKTVDGYSITYKLNPSQPKAQSDFNFNLSVAQNGKPVTDLQTYLGALGHSVILREGTLDFIHAHAGEASSSGAMMDHGNMMQNTSTKGPDINFSTSFPEPGIYKLFTQFQHKGKVVTTDYIINVK
jgi:hypothetical protein